MKTQVFLFLLFASSLIYSQPNQNNTATFYYDDRIGDKYTIKTTSKKDILMNNKLFLSFQQEYTAEFKVTKVESGESLIEGDYTFFEIKGDKSILIPKKNTHTQFSRTKNGIIKTQGEQAENDQFLPSIRSVPAFTDDKVKINQAWTSDGDVALDFRQFGQSKPVLIKVNALHHYVKNETVNGNNCAVIAVDFVINFNSSSPIGLAYKQLWKSLTGRYPARIMALFHGEYYYSFDVHDVISFESHFNHLFFMENNTIQELIGHDKGEVIGKIR